MQSNPHTSGANDTLPSGVPGAAEGIPAVCVVCGATTKTTLTYSQDFMPIILPSIAFIGSQLVTLPYCQMHAKAFSRRLWWLRAFQNAGYVALLAILIVGTRNLGNGEQRWLWTIGLYALLACLAASIFIVKPLMYDVFVSAGKDRLRVRGGCYEFRQAVANKHVECD